MSNWFILEYFIPWYFVFFFICTCCWNSTSSRLLATWLAWWIFTCVLGVDIFLDFILVGTMINSFEFICWQPWRKHSTRVCVNVFIFGLVYLSWYIMPIITILGDCILIHILFVCIYRTTPWFHFILFFLSKLGVFNEIVGWVFYRFCFLFLSFIPRAFGTFSHLAIISWFDIAFIITIKLI